MADNFDVFEQNVLYLTERSKFINDQKKITFELSAQRLSEEYDTLSSRINKADELLSKACASDCIAFFKVLTQNNVSPAQLWAEHNEPYEHFSRAATSKISYVKNNQNDKCDEVRFKNTDNFEKHSLPFCDGVMSASSGQGGAFVASSAKGDRE